MPSPGGTASGKANCSVGQLKKGSSVDVCNVCVVFASRVDLVNLEMNSCTCE